jgi:hypothetical protein
MLCCLLDEVVLTLCELKGAIRLPALRLLVLY